MGFSGKLEIVKKTDTGLRREQNEDSVGSELSMGLAVLADGMGGHNSGEIASAMAVSHIIEKFKADASKIKVGDVDWESGMTRETLLLGDAIVEANGQIHAASLQNVANRGMGTTVVGMLFLDNKVSIGHVGDSRAYRLRSGRLEQLTEDHSLLQELIRKGFYTREEAEQSGQKNVITRALGIEADVEAELIEDVVDVDDIYLACSDGLTDMVTDERIQEIIMTRGDDIAGAADELIVTANENGGKDNISVILVRVVKPFPLTETLADKMVGWFRD